MGILAKTTKHVSNSFFNSFGKLINKYKRCRITMLLTIIAPKVYANPI